jgi:hypothetical protein
MIREAVNTARPGLVLAPHLQYPLRNGSDISLDRLARHLSSDLPYIVLIGEDNIVRFEGGDEIERIVYKNGIRSKPVAALRTVAFRSHFFLEKFVTRSFEKVARLHLANPEYGTVMSSYISTADLVVSSGEAAERRLLIWTHNDEFKWFRDLQKSGNPFVRLASKLSEQWLHNFFDRHQEEFIFLHVTEADHAGFAAYHPEHPAAVIPIGVDVEVSDPPALAPGSVPVRLFFVGSLSMKMNLDALSHFADRYLPPLRHRFGEALEVMIAGSNPAPAVQQLCQSHGWSLHPNVSDEELRRLFLNATFSILPFPYATGAKLKLLNSLAHGVPFLATERISAQEETCVYPSLIADDPTEWLARIEVVRKEGISPSDRERILNVARQYSWAESARRITGLLATHA